MTYSVVLDSKNSYIVEKEDGHPFKDAVKIILDYVKDAGYSTQETLWEIALDSGEEAYLNNK